MKSLFKPLLGLLILPVFLLVACSKPSFELASGGKADIVGESRVVFVNYWAVWCGPCIAEMPELAHFNDIYSDRAIVYAVNFDNPPLDQLRADMQALGVDIPALAVDPQIALGYERPQVLPTTYVLHLGQVKEVLVGPQTQESLLGIMEAVEAQR